MTNLTHANDTVSMVLAKWQRTFNHYTKLAYCIIWVKPHKTELGGIASLQ